MAQWHCTVNLSLLNICILVYFACGCKKHTNVNLTAHNGRRFDFPVLLSALMNITYDEQFMECVMGFIDSIYVFKKAYPAQSLCKQENLAWARLYKYYIFHNAMEEVKMLGKFVSLTKMNTNELTNHTFPPTEKPAEIQHRKDKESDTIALSCWKRCFNGNSWKGGRIRTKSRTLEKNLWKRWRNSF